ncbi:4'-phosphopantetheinyl transferase family protein [Arthrobacter bambusae]|uniref:4'-phosphopantetheinyl transferase family protein n=1 Tax=Arthrobacter bambusae TaxID=1338426 RepID=UPI00277EFA3C|nr:4'-phosphopantetheinyl transferase superfamily protein [Arthrobacter bambusae]MDQ0028915.1 4'-phosphopantetheinyl transferase [Arthrobacter bambusae]MDQ0098683.1 4'-phosphopantetheinyl transferase [Arthrobacter bambusae]
MAAELLSPAESLRADAMAPVLRRDFLASRLAQQYFAASLLGVPAAKLRASYACPECGAGPDIAHGRPGYVLDGGPAPLMLSASRSSGWVLFAAVVHPEPGLQVGVDLENAAGTEFAGFDDVALTERERRHLNTVDAGSRAHERARLWARKEAWLKMTGEGLRVAPDSLDVLERPGLWDLELPDSADGRDLPAGLLAALAVTSR